MNYRQLAFLAQGGIACGQPIPEPSMSFVLRVSSTFFEG